MRIQVVSDVHTEFHERPLTKPRRRPYDRTMTAYTDLQRHNSQAILRTCLSRGKTPQEVSQETRIPLKLLRMQLTRLVALGGLKTSQGTYTTSLTGRDALNKPTIV
jgi:hypothetical protein